MAKTRQRLKKRTFIILGAIVLLIIALLLYFYFIGGNSAAEVYVMSVGDITGATVSGTANRFSGVVESQETLEIHLDSGRTLDEVYVQVGQDVAVGDKLFSYDKSDIGLQLSQINLDIERMDSAISTSRDEITLLENEKKSAPSENQLDYTLQIQSLQAEIKQTEYNMRAKQLEYDQLKKKYDNSVVTSSMAGSIKAINDPNSGGDAYSGSTSAFIVIMKAGDYKIKGTATELNLYDLSVDMPVVIRSRVSAEQTWKGYISDIDTSQPVENENSDYYYYGSGNGESASKYAFYVNMDTTEGLIMGQHVTIEPDYGQADTADGLFLGSYFMVIAEDGSAYVWASTANDRLEKRNVTLGEYNAELDTYEILEGLSLEDYIAFPTEDLKAGMRTTKEYVIEDPIYEEDPVYEDGDKPSDEVFDPEGFDEGDTLDVDGDVVVVPDKRESLQ